MVKFYLQADKKKIYSNILEVMSAGYTSMTWYDEKSALRNVSYIVFFWE